MYLLSMTPLDTEHIDEICEDLKMQQETGVSTHAMMMMYFAPEGTPPVNRAEYFCEKYDLFRKKLDAEGVKHGVLVQSTLGHGAKPNSEHPFQKFESLTENGEVREVCCPFDKGYLAYIKEQMATLAKHKPSIIMIDDDMGLLYRWDKGCTCPLHMAEFNKRAGTNMTREQLYKHTQGNSDEDKYYTDIYIRVQGDSLVGAAKAMREGIDSVDPTIQGAISLAGNYCEFTDELAEAFAGKGNPTIARFNNGMYTAPGSRFFTKNMVRAAAQKEILGDKIDYLLAETDTCPQNRYSTSASLLHAHFTGTILEGAKGAKHWITRTSAFEPESGKAYRKILAKNSGFYEELSKLAEELKPVGCRIPLSKVKDYCLTTPNIFAVLLSHWATNVLERFGFPLYFSAKDGGAVFLDDSAPDKFTDEQIKEFLKGTLVLTAQSAKKLEERGFDEYTGVKVKPLGNRRTSGEILKVNGNKIATLHGLCELVPVNEKVIADSEVIHIPTPETKNILFPGSTIYKNNLGGAVMTFSGTPDTDFKYNQAFSFLCESRKLQFVKFLKETGNLPIYYPGDVDVYMRAGYLNDNSLMVALFNICLDPIDEISLICDKKINKIEKLTSEGKRITCDFYEQDGVIYVKEPLNTLAPVVLFIS
ncbi:MAG: hypothetical protein J6A69_12235 [Clostridia bacterium]|nr:hypothetical protein [Clostridia bacterium]